MSVTKAITDDVLRGWVAHARENMIDAERFPDRAALAAELLAARSALRGLLRVSEAPVSELDLHGPNPDHISPFVAARSCLPEGGG